MGNEFGDFLDQVVPPQPPALGKWVRPSGKKGVAHDLLAEVASDLLVEEVKEKKKKWVRPKGTGAGRKCPRVRTLTKSAIIRDHRTLLPEWAIYAKDPMSRDRFGRVNHTLLKQISKLSQREQTNLLMEVQLRGLVVLRERFKTRAKPPRPREEVYRKDGFGRSTYRLLKEAKEKCRAAAEATDGIFVSQGLGVDARNSGWKLRIDAAHRQLLVILREIEIEAIRQDQG